MGQLGIPNLQRLEQKGASKLIPSLNNALEEWDYDRGWLPTASPHKHRLGVIPTQVLIEVSADKRGATFTQIQPDSVTRTEIAFTTALAYARVRANR